MFNMAIVGMGKMSQEHARWIDQNKDMQLVAICEKNIGRHEELRNKYNIEIYSTVEELLKNKKLDFVVITTTNEVHEEIAIKVLNQGINVIVEKPMTMTYESAQRMIKAAEKNNKYLLVHQSSRWDREYLSVKKYIDDGFIGELLVIQSKVIFCDEFWPSWGIDGMKNPWRVKAKYGGGLLYDWGPHLIDQIVQIMGQFPLGVFGMLQKAVWSSEVDDHFFATLKYEDNKIAQIEVCNNGRIPLPRWYVIGTKGTLIVPGKSEPFWDEVELNYIKDNGKNEIIKTKLIGVTESGLEGGFYTDLTLFLEGKIKDFVSMNDVANVIKVLELIKRSSDEQKYYEFK